MSLLFIVIVHILIFTTTSQTITPTGDDIICDTSQNQCTVNCIDTNCNNIKIYSSSNNTLINCNSQSSCLKTNLICIGNYNECILSCPVYDSCVNSTVTCNENNNAKCKCQGIGCPIISIPTDSNINTNEISNKITDSPTDGAYSINQPVLIALFSGFCFFILCCFCILLIALSFIGLYFGEKKKTNIQPNKVSFSSSERGFNNENININGIKYEKSEATHRMSYLSRSNKNMSYDTTVSFNMSNTNNDDEKDDITEQQLQIPQQIDEQCTIDMTQIINDSKLNVNNKSIVNNKSASVDVNLAELGNQFETENKNEMQEESATQTSIQHEGILKNKQLSISIANRDHQKFDSEDLYIIAQSTLQHPPISIHNKHNINEINLKLNEEKKNEFQNENKINDIGSDDKKSMDDIGSDDECVPELDGHNQFHTKPNLSINNISDSTKYTLDGHNRNNNNTKIINNLKPKGIMVENNDNDINVDISAQLPSSPADLVAAADVMTKHPPKTLLLHPPTKNGNNKNNKIDMHHEGNQSQTSVNGDVRKKNDIENKNDNDEKDEKIDEEKKGDQLCIIRVNDGNGNMNGVYDAYNEDDYKKTINPLHNMSNNRERVPLMETNTSISETISTFTIKSNPPSLSRTTSLNSAAAVRVAFPNESHHITKPKNSYFNNMTNMTNITNYITHKNRKKNKHKNYYSEQFYNFKPHLIHFDPKHNLNNLKTPPNSNKTDISISNITTIGTEKPILYNNLSSQPNLHNVISASMIVPSLPNSPNNGIIIDDIPPPRASPPHIINYKSDDSVKTTIIRTRPKSGRKKKKSSSSRSKSSRDRTRDSIGSGNTIITKQSKSRSSKSSSKDTYRNSHTHSSTHDSKNNNKINNKKHRKRSSPKSANNNNNNKIHRRKTVNNYNNNNNPSQIVMKPKRKVRRNRHESVPSYNNNNNKSKSNNSDINNIKKHSSPDVARSVKINRSTKLMLKQSYDKNVEIPIKTSKSVNGTPKWAKNRIIMTPPVDIHHISKSNNNIRRNIYDHENNGFNNNICMPSQSMFITNIIK